MTPAEEYADLEQQRRWWEQHLADIKANDSLTDDVKEEEIRSVKETIALIDERMNDLFPFKGGIQ